MSEASAHKLSYIKETTRGTTPTYPVFTALPDTRNTLALTRDVLESERISGDRFPSEPRAGIRGVGGDIPCDLSIRDYDDFIASALQGEWVESGGVDTVDLDLNGGTPSVMTTVGQTEPVTEGDVYIHGLDAKAGKTILRFEPTAPSGPAEFYELFGAPSAVVTIDGLDTYQVLGYVDAAEEATVIAGDTRLSFSVLREFSDFAAGEKPFLLYNGMEVASWNLSAAANDLAKSTFTFFGRDMVGPSLTAPTYASVAPAFDGEPFNTFSGSLKIDGVEGCTVTDYSITINNGHAPRYAVGCDTSGDPSVTQSFIESTFTLYFEDAVLYEKFVNEGSISTELTLADSANNQMIITMPNQKIGAGAQPDVTDDGPITITINTTAHKDDALGSHISVRRLYPVAV